MKKNFCKLLALVVVALMMMSTMALANPAVDVDDLTATTVTLTGLPEGEEATVLVVKADTDLENLQNSDIIYIDQLTIADNNDDVENNGEVVFTMDVSAAAIADNNAVDKVDVYCGYTSMTTVLAAYDVAVEEEVTGPEFDLTKSEIKASAPFGMTGYKRVFLKVTEPGAWTLTHSDAASEIYYSTEREGYDCVLKTEATTIDAVIAEITGVKEAPVAAMTISLYGDASGDSKVNALDSVNVKKYILKTLTNESLGLKKVLGADTTGDSKVNALDSVNLKKYILKTITEMPVASTNK